MLVQLLDDGAGRRVSSWDMVLPVQSLDATPFLFISLLDSREGPVADVVTDVVRDG